MTLHYTCDGTGCPTTGEPRGPAKHKPEGWLCAIVDGRMVDLCAACAATLRREREAAK